MNNFTEALGTFWTHVFEDRFLINDAAEAYQLSLFNAYFKLMEVILGESVFDIPILNRHNWYHLNIRQDLNGVNVENSIRYGDGFNYGDGYLYGGTIPGYNFSIKIDDSITYVSDFICNSIYAPTKILIKDRDFIFINNTLHFVNDPLDGNIRGSFWIPTVKMDKRYLWRRYGSLTGVYSEHSTEVYKQMLGSLFAIFYEGPLKRNVLGFVYSIFGIPTIKEREEVIQNIENDGLKITTDYHIYNIENPFLVRDGLYTGQSLKRFEPLTKGIDYIDNDTDPNWWKVGTFFTIPAKLLGEGYKGSLKVFNQNIVYNNIIGDVQKMPVSGDMSAEREKLFNKFPLHFGMPIVLGEPYVYVNSLDFFATQVINNLFVLEINPIIINTENNNSAYWSLFEKIIPVDLAYIVRYNIEGIIDEYLTDDVTNTIEFPDGITPLDRTMMNINAKDGYWGVLLIGQFTLGDGSYIGEHKLNPAPYLEIREK